MPIHSHNKVQKPSHYIGLGSTISDFLIQLVRPSRHFHRCPTGW